MLYPIIGRVLPNLIEAVGNSETSGVGFTVTGASAFAIDLTSEMFLAACLEENARRMSCFDDSLLQPQLMPAIGKATLSILQFAFGLQPRPQERIRICEY